MRRALVWTWLVAGLACATGEADAPATAAAAEPGVAAPEAPSRTGEDGELWDCSLEYGALPTARSYILAINDVAASYMAAQRLHDRLRQDPSSPPKQVDEAWQARVGAAQTLVRACHCWEQLDRVTDTDQVLAAGGTSTRQLKAEIGTAVAVPCQKVFDAEAANR